LGVQSAELQDAYSKFQLVDTDRSGNISFEEMKQLLKLTVAKAMKEEMLDRYARFEFQSVDADRSGSIDFYEFLQVSLRLPLPFFFPFLIL